MGTSLYLDTFYNKNSLNELMLNLGQKYGTSISITLLSGENHELHKKNEVQNLYRKKLVSILRLEREFFNLFGQWFRYNNSPSHSLNDDLENLFRSMISTNYFHSQSFTRKTCWLRWFELKLKEEVRSLFLYEMLSEDEIKTKPDLIRRSEDDQYLLSLCRVLTVNF